jgi:hypothetical protein
MSYIYGVAANASKWQMGFNLAFKGLIYRFSKHNQMPNFMKFRPVGADLFHADGQTSTKLIVAFRSFTNVPPPKMISLTS